MDRTGDQHVKLIKPDSERQILHVFAHLCSLKTCHENRRDAAVRQRADGEARDRAESRGRVVREPGYLEYHTETMFYKVNRHQ